jgi:hypothetical protein
MLTKVTHIYFPLVLINVNLTFVALQKIRDKKSMEQILHYFTTSCVQSKCTTTNRKCHRLEGFGRSNVYTFLAILPYRFEKFLFL